MDLLKQDPESARFRVTLRMLRLFWVEEGVDLKEVD